MKNKQLDKNLVMKLLGYKFGGELLNTIGKLPLEEGLQMAPGLMNIVSTAVSGIQEANAGARKARTSLAASIKEDNNPFYELGGDLKKFTGASHEQGGIPVDSQMNPGGANPVGEVEGEEAGYKDKNGSYIYSKALEDFANPGQSYADTALNIGKKYSRPDDISKKTAEFELKNLKTRNDKSKEMVQGMAEQGEEIYKRLGGKLEKYQFGGYPSASSLLSALDGVTPPTNPNDPFGLSTPKRAPGYIAPVYDDVSGIGTFDGESDDLLSPDEHRTMIAATQGLFKDVPKPTGTTETTQGVDGKGLNYNKLAVGLKAAGLAKSFSDSLQGVEENILRENPYKDEVAGLMEGRRVDLTPILNEITMGKNAALRRADNMSSSITGEVLGQSAIQRAARGASDVVSKAQQINNQYIAEEAKIKGALGSEQRGEQIRHDDVGARDRATRRGFSRDFFGNLTKVGSQFNKKALVDQQIREGLAILGMKYKDFGMADDVYARIKDGTYTYDDWIIFKGAEDKALNAKNTQ